MFLVDAGGLIVPAPISASEWAAGAIIEQAQLQIPEDREAVARVRPAKAKPVPGPVRVRSIADGQIIEVGRIDGAEMVASGSYTALP